MLDCGEFESDLYADLQLPAIGQVIDTMRRLFLFRHAKAERPEMGTDDFSRALTERGRKDAARIGAFMATHALTPDRVLVSPAARTQQTWKALATTLKPAPAATTVEKLYDATLHTILATIKDAPPAAHSLMVVAHNPGIQELALMLIASGDVDARESLHEKLPTSGLIIIDFAFDDWSKLHPQSGRLERFISPRTLDPAAG